MTRESRALVAGPASTHVPWWLIAAPVVAAAVLVAGALAAQEVRRWLHVTLPAVSGVDVYAALYDVRPVPLTVTAASERVPVLSTYEAVRTDATLWRRMHLADWNHVPEPLQRQALDAMLDRYRHLLLAPARWDRMTADDWDEVPQPVRVLAYRHMVEYWTGFYQVGEEHLLPPRLVSDTLAAIVMSESWFDHRAVNVGYEGQRDYGLAQASEFARARLQQRYARGEVDVLLSDDDYFNPWSATRFVAIWMQRLLEQTGGDLDFAVRAYHRGVSRAFDERGDGYLAAVQRRRHRFIRNEASPGAWDYLWRRDRALRLEAWPWIVVRPRGGPIEQKEGSDEGGW